MKYLLLFSLTFFSWGMFVYAESDIQTSYWRSYNYERTEDYDNAIKSIMVVYQQYPKGYTVNLRLGWLYYLKGAYANSIQYYQAAIKSIPTSIDAKLGLTLPLMAQSKWEQVEQVLYQVLNVDYYNYYGNLRLVVALRMQKKWELSESVIQKMLVVFPSNVSFLAELAQLKEQTQQPKVAKALYDDLLILDPENVAARVYFEKN